MPVHVASPFGYEIIHTFELSAGGVATSGIGKRSWLGPDGSPAHHLLDPGTGKPAFTGVVQVTAIAPTRDGGGGPKQGGAPQRTRTARRGGCPTVASSCSTTARSGSSTEQLALWLRRGRSGPL